jgi:hypothetical protein
MLVEDPVLAFSGPDLEPQHLCPQCSLRIHYDPKHGSWLHVAEIELSTMSGECLDRRIHDRETLERAVAAWEAERNTLGRSVNWRFTTADARVKPKRICPVVDG